MRKPGSKGAPSAADLKNSQNEEYTGSDPKSNDPNNPLSRMDGTYSGAKVYADKTPGQKLAHTVGGSKPNKTLKTIKKVMKEDAIADSDRLTKFKKVLADAALDQKINAVKVSVGDQEPEPHPATQLPTKFADRKKAAQTTDTNTGVKKPDINGDVQRNINSRLAPVLGGLKQKMDGKFRQNSISRMSEENINEISVPLGTTGNRTETHMKTGPVRDVSGKIIKTTVFKSGSSRGGGSGDGSDE
jgi:hypothetical protein